MAYTIKGWDLPIAGHIDNHAAQLTQAHITAMQERLGIAVGHEWDGYDVRTPSPSGSSRRSGSSRCQPLPSLIGATGPLRVPETLGMRFPERASTRCLWPYFSALSDIKK